MFDEVFTVAKEGGPIVEDWVYFFPLVMVFGHAKVIATSPDFTLTITNALSANGQVIQCGTATSLDLDKAELIALSFFAPFVNLGFVIEGIVTATVGPPGGLHDGVGCAVVGLFSHEVLLPPGPQGAKVSFNYVGVEVQTEAVIARADVTFPIRNPRSRSRGRQL